MKPTVQRIAIGSGIHTAEWLISTRAGQALLAGCHQGNQRPRCMCIPKGVPMYVGRRGQVYYLSRMPGTGFIHAETCVSVESAALFSGAYAYESGAILEAADGRLVLQANPGCVERQDSPLTEVRIDGLLDILLEQADLNRLAPDSPKRTWNVVRERLLEAAEWVRLGDAPLTEQLFIPERFSKEDGDALHAKCEAFLKAHRAQAYLIAPLRDIRQTTYSLQLHLKHLPHLRLWIPKETAEAIENRVGRAILHDMPAFALCLAAVRPGRRDGNYTVTNLATLTTDANFLPCANAGEAAIAAALLNEGLTLLRPLRFDCPREFPLADFAVLDQGNPEPVFVLAATGDDLLDASKRAMAGLMQRNRVAARIYPA